ncbi:MAG: anaerobic ribonucleoside-triphosphate reductase activating protein [Desulfuromonadales bacterium]|nr:anaerobic ribonucleoside-triphosphate reductase activating protein [Desulfuromonadales bacterium]
MKIKGFQGTSLLDFPGRIASLVFFGHCNLTCPFCHNPTLVQNPDQYPDYPLEELLAELKSRSRFIDGVVISGGEPTLDSDCIVLMRAVKALDLQIKLDSNGLRPDRLALMLSEQLLDYVALDLKTTPTRYGELHSAPVDHQALGKSIELLMQSGVDYEFRTTCVPGMVTAADIDAIGGAIRGAGLWVLQQFVTEQEMIAAPQVEPYPKEVLYAYRDQAREYVKEVMLRGV